VIYVNDKYRFLICLIEKCGSTSGIRWLLEMEDCLKDDITHQHGQTSRDWWKCSKHGNIWDCRNIIIKKLRDYPPNVNCLLKNYCKTVLAKAPFKRFERWRGFAPPLRSRKYLLRNYYKILFVRNPWKRLVSVYLDKFCTGNFLMLEQAKYAAKYIYEKYSLDYKVCDDYENQGGITFNQFLDYIDNHPDGLLDNHWKPQYLFLEGINYDSVIKIESIQHDIMFVKRKLGIKEDFPQIKLSNIVYHELEGDCATCFPSDLLKLKSKYGYFPSYKNFFSAELVELVAKRYKKDVKLFNYKFDA